MVLLCGCGPAGVRAQLTFEEACGSDPGATTSLDYIGFTQSLEKKFADRQQVAWGESRNLVSRAADG
jgi:hypothetical protein